MSFSCIHSSSEIKDIIQNTMKAYWYKYSENHFDFDISLTSYLLSLNLNIIHENSEFLKEPHSKHDLIS